MNILIKLMSIVSLVIAPTLAQVHGTVKAQNGKETSKTTIKVDSKIGETKIYAAKKNDR
jgi:K(+)-stimulated pyrophosphate-energized sodium pump